jgi:HAD superfamily hydrolase (TIGR01509 family)
MTSHRLLTWTPAAIVFDCDGTLLDTERHWHTARRRTARDAGIRTRPGFAERSKGLHYTECGQLMAREAGRPELAERLTERLLAHYRELALESPRTMPGAREVVAGAAKSAPVAVASNCPIEVVEECLGAAHLLPYFSHIVAPAPGIRPKPRPDVYLAAVRRCGVPPGDALAVEDSRCGIEAATRAGLRVLGVGPWPGEDLASLADLWVTALDEPRVFEWMTSRTTRRPTRP